MKLQEETGSRKTYILLRYRNRWQEIAGTRTGTMYTVVSVVEISERGRSRFQVKKRPLTGNSGGTADIGEEEGSGGEGPSPPGGMVYFFCTMPGMARTTGLAMNTVEYTPEMTPTIMAKAKSWITLPPNKKRHTHTMNTVSVCLFLFGGSVIHDFAK